MVIKSSASAEIRHLVAALGGDDEVAREAAIARLGIIGSRAVDRLVTAYRAAPSLDTRVAILRALEPCSDDRALGIAREALGAGGDLGAAAAGVLRGLLEARQAATATSALDALMAVVMDGSAEHRLRLAAGDALREVPAVRDQVTAALEGLPDAAAQIRPAGGHEAAAAGAIWQDAIEGHLPDRPASLREAIALRAGTAPLGLLQALVEAIRAHEGTVAPGRLRDDWRGQRGALHQVLALRGSRLALYDVRESLERATEPLPPSFLAALHAVGDQSCLEALAAAHHHARDDDARWKTQLREAFQAIARREHLTRRSAAMKRVASKWPESFKDLTA